MNITKYKKLNMTEHKTDMSITKIDKYIKNWTAIQWRSTRHNQIQKYKHYQIQKTKHDRTQNRHEHYWKTEQHFYHRTQN